VHAAGGFLIGFFDNPIFPITEIGLGL